VEAEDLVLCAFLAFVFVPFVALSLVASAFLKRAGKAYLPDEPVLAEQMVQEAGPFVLTIPAGPACTVMVRSTVRGSANPGGKGLRYGLNAVLDATRERPGQAPFQAHREGAFGSMAKRKVAEGTVLITSVAYIVEKFDGELTQTHVLITLPAGGEATVRGTLESATSLSFATVFAKAWT
jgi:hypothetical protein